MSRADDSYLWDRTGAEDPDVAALEQALGPLAHDGRPFQGARPERRRFRAHYGIAAALLIGLGTWMLVRRPAAPESDQDEIQLAAEHSGEWFEATTRSRTLLLADGMGDVTIEPGSRLQVRRVDPEATRFYLQRGQLDAFVVAQARFFQVETPSTTCIDLGCRYKLTVDDAGESHVVVTTGEVAFENPDGSEVFVPNGAECRANHGSGLGTPRFVDADSRFRTALDAFDDTSGAETRRRDLARKLLALAGTPRDTLSLWHLLADRDAEIALAAERRISELVGWPPEQAAQKMVPQGLDPEVGKAFLEEFWF